MSTPMVEQLRARYRDRALAPDTLFLLNANDAMDLLGEACSAGIVLAGVEGFIVTDAGAYQPRQEFSNDMSDFDGSADQFVEETRNLIKHGANVGIRFQIVFEETA